MQRLEVSGVVRYIYGSLDVKGLKSFPITFLFFKLSNFEDGNYNLFQIFYFFLFCLLDSTSVSRKVAQLINVGFC